MFNIVSDFVYATLVKYNTGLYLHSPLHPLLPDLSNTAIMFLLVTVNKK